MVKKTKTRTANPITLFVVYPLIFLFSAFLMWIGMYLGFVIASTFCGSGIHETGCQSVLQEVLFLPILISIPVLFAYISIKCTIKFLNNLRPKIPVKIGTVISFVASIIVLLVFLISEY